MFRRRFEKADIAAKDITIRGSFRDPSSLASEANGVLITSRFYKSEDFESSNWELLVTRMVKEHPDFKLLVTEVH